jgi:hypothetical protein
MTATILDRDFIERLPERAIVHNVPWDQYDALLHSLDPAPRRRARLRPRDQQHCPEFSHAGVRFPDNVTQITVNFRTRL